MRTAILQNEKRTGVTIMLVDKDVDHGPILAQKVVDFPEWPPRLADMERSLMRTGGALLAEILLPWIAGDIEAHPQHHDLATFSRKLTKEDGLLDLSADAYTNLLKIRALEDWPGTYAFFERNGQKIRTQILDADLKSATLHITRIRPEGKRDMDYADFIRSGARPATV